MQKLLILGVMLACASERGTAQDASVAPDPDEITVLATGIPDTMATTGQPITIIGADEIAQMQGGDIARVLERTPGLSLSRNGGPGSFTAVSLRGAAAEQVLVVIDGVRVADPAAPGGGYDFGTLLPAGLGKIEILRGSNGTIWGSQAIGGVLAASSAKEPGLDATAEYGARDTFYATAHAGAEVRELQLAANAGWYRTDGFSAAAAGTEPDGFRQGVIGGTASVGVAQGLRLRGSMHYADSRTDIDGYPAPDYVLADTPEYQDTRQFTALAGLDYSGSRLQIAANWSSADTQRANFDPSIGTAPTYSTDGRSSRLDVRGSWQIGATSLWFGGENEQTNFASTVDSRHSARTSGLYAQVGRTVGPVSLNVGARVADHSRFGSATTFGADAAWKLGQGWRLRASYGEGFKAPTLFQLFSDYGNAALRPERSSSADLGVELNERDSSLYLSATVFRRDSEALIDFVSCFGLSDGICTGRPFGTYDNVGRARAQGIELEGRYEVLRGLTARATYSLVDAVDRTPGSPNRGHRLARRPQNLLSLGGDWRVSEAGGSLGADLRWVSASFDDAANVTRLGPYAVLDLTANWPVSDKIALYGRIENLWNERYQISAGYASPPRGAFVGARVGL